MGKLGGILAVAGVAVSILKPMLPMIRGLGKMLGEFLRPIADVIMMLLTPILTLLRPILITFKAMMAPFKQAAMVGLAASQKLINQGMQLGGEVGDELKLEGLKGSFAAASLMLSGFVGLLIQPFTKIDFMGIGDAIQKGLDTWKHTSIQGVMRAVMLSETVDGLTGKFGSLQIGGVNALSSIEGQIAALTLSVGQFKIENFQEDLEKAKAVSAVVLDIFNLNLDITKKKAGQVLVPFDEYLDDLKETANGTGLEWAALIGALRVGTNEMTAFYQNLDILTEKFTKLNKIIAGEAFVKGNEQQSSGMDWVKVGVKTAAGAAIGASIASIGTGILGAIGGGMGGGLAGAISGGMAGFKVGAWAGAGLGGLIGSIGSIAEQLIDMSKEKKKWATQHEEMTTATYIAVDTMNRTFLDGYEDLNTNTTTLTTDMNKIMETGIKEILEYVGSSFNPTTGTIVNTFDKGLDTMILSMDNSILNFKNFGETLEEIAEDAADSAEDAKRSANSASRSSSRARANANASAIGAVI